VQNRTAFRLAYSSTGGCKKLQLTQKDNVHCQIPYNKLLLHHVCYMTII